MSTPPPPKHQPHPKAYRPPGPPRPHQYQYQYQQRQQQQKQQLPRSLQPKLADINSPAYKQTARKYVNFMIAMPILLVTSYVLFDRLVMGTPVKTLPRGPVIEQQQQKKMGKEEEEDTAQG